MAVSEPGFQPDRARLEGNEATNSLLEPNFAAIKENKAHEAYAKTLIENAWSNMPEVFVRRLMESLPRRLRACRKAGGWYSVHKLLDNEVFASVRFQIEYKLRVL